MSSIRNLILPFVLFVLLHQLCLAQSIKIMGTVRNELTNKPVPEANIRIYGTKQGTATDKNGDFTLVLDQIPATVVISCIGYDYAKYDILKKSATPVVLLLRPISYILKEVEISAVSHTVLYEDKTFSVLDFELMGDNVVMLVFRNVAKRAGMVLLTRAGDAFSFRSFTVFDEKKTHFHLPDEPETKAFLNIFFDLCEIERRKMEKTLNTGDYAISQIDSVYRTTLNGMNQTTAKYLEEAKLGKNKKALLKWNAFVLENLDIDNLKLLQPFSR